jgi:hypothetical protein
LPNDGASRPDQLSSEGGRHEKLHHHVHRAVRRTRRQLGGKRRELRLHPHYSYVGNPALPDARFDAQLQADTVTCDDAVGVQRATPSATYRGCMLAHGWKYSYVTRTKVQAAPAQADPYFSSNVKVKPGHFIDHDDGMDCQNIGGAKVEWNGALFQPGSEPAVHAHRRDVRLLEPLSTKTEWARRSPLDHSKPVAMRFAVVPGVAGFKSGFARFK